MVATVFWWYLGSIPVLNELRCLQVLVTVLQTVHDADEVHYLDVLTHMGPTVMMTTQDTNK